MRRSSTLLRFLFVMLCATCAQAQSTWTGAAGDGRWGNGNNWTPSGVPNNDAMFLGSISPAGGTIDLDGAAWSMPMLDFQTSSPFTLTNGALTDVFVISSNQLANTVNANITGDRGTLFIQNVTVSGSIGEISQSSVTSLFANGTFSGENTYTGNTVVTGPMSLTGEKGSIRSTSAIRLNGGPSGIRLDNSAAVDSDRIPDSATIAGPGGVELDGNAQAGVTEIAGLRSMESGANSLIVVSNGAPATLSFAAINRLAHATLDLTLGGSTPELGKVLVRSAPGLSLVGGGAMGTPMTSILPYASAPGASLVTYDPGPDGIIGTADDMGLRPLNASTEYLPSLSPGAATANVRLTSNQSLAGTATINALSINGATLSLSAGSRVMLSSGALALGGGNSAFQTTSVTGAGTLDFGPNEAIISTEAPGDFPSPAPRYLVDASITGSGPLVKSGLGTLVLSQANALSGGIVINEGILVSQAQGALGTGPISGSATLAFELRDQSVSNPILVDNIDVASGLKVTFISNSSNSGLSDLQKQGGGMAILAGQINQQPNISIFNGTLRVDGSITGPGGVVTPMPGGVLAGSGTIDATVSARSTGSIEPGAGSSIGVSTLTIGDLKLAGIDFRALLRSDANDQIAILRTANLDGGTLDISFGDSPSVGEQYKVIDNLGSASIAGTFTGLPEGTLFSAGADELQITYEGGDGNDVVLTVVGVPEPASVGLVLIAGGMLLTRRRRSRPPLWLPDKVNEMIATPGTS
jgi:autotransporter-associated beta strand protein